MRTSKANSLVFFLVIGIGVCALFVAGMIQTAAAATHAALPYPNAATPKPIDRGLLREQSGTTPIAVTVALRLPKLDEAENLLKALHTPGDPQFHKFLTADQFKGRFAPSNADVAKVITALSKYGLVAERTTTTTLRATGLPADMERAFAVSLHSYEVPAHGSTTGYTFHAPVGPLSIPTEISASVVAVVGLDDRPSFRPHMQVAPHAMARAQSAASSASGNPPGLWTVTDFAKYYDVQPLYNAGITGKGHTIGIITLAAFTKSDAYAYWKALGLTVNPNRIKVVNIDGGPGAPSDFSGSGETTLDVEQSGGIAPGANIIVYQAPNTNQGFLDLFAAATDDNIAETLSTSWGLWEWFNNLRNAPVKDPITGEIVSDLRATHELLVQAAIQGQSVSAAAGDNGAYDADDGCVLPYSTSSPGSCSEVLSVDYPASDPAIAAGGGTTLAGPQQLCLNEACTPPFFNVTVKHERVWGWDYLEGWCAAIGAPNPIDCGIFAGGGGGGVSVLFARPDYQFFLPGIQNSQPDQVFKCVAPSPGTGCLGGGLGLYYALPANYPGRNVPDVSLNADPDTGYVIYYTSEPSGVFGIATYIGGTSFVAPQLNGVSALLGEYVNGRIGLINYPLYELALSHQAYGGAGAPLRAIANGDNWFYLGSHGYNPGAGLGSLDVANLTKVLASQY